MSVTTELLDKMQSRIDWIERADIRDDEQRSAVAMLAVRGARDAIEMIYAVDDLETAALWFSIYETFRAVAQRCGVMVYSDGTVDGNGPATTTAPDGAGR